MKNIERKLRGNPVEYSLPLQDQTVIIRLASPMTELDWELLMDILTAMKPGLVYRKPDLTLHHTHNRSYSDGESK